jgi:hypothetical protein
VTKQSQRKKILKLLERGRGITQLQALDMFGCMRLGGRICELREQGYDIQTERVKTRTGKIIARYKLRRA